MNVTDFSISELKLNLEFISLETKCLFLRVFFVKYNGTIIFEL